MRFIKTIIALIWAGIIAWGIGLVTYATAIPTPRTITGTYDAIIVLTGGEDRIAYGTALYRRGVAQHLFITGVSDDYVRKELPDVSKPSIAYGNKARSTFGNIRETIGWLQGKSHHSLLIVTANYHMPRVELLYSHHLPDYTLDYAPVSPPHFKREDWLTHPNSLRLLLSEYHKYLISYGWLKILGIDTVPERFL